MTLGAHIAAEPGHVSQQSLGQNLLTGRGQVRGLETKVRPKIRAPLTTHKHRRGRTRNRDRERERVRRRHNKETPETAMEAREEVKVRSRGPVPRAGFEGSALCPLQQEARDKSETVVVQVRASFPAVP